MTLTLGVISAAVVLNGLLAGLSFDAALVKLPARKRIGAIAYAAFARGNDLGRGLVVYPALAIAAGLSALAAAVLAFADPANGKTRGVLVAAAAATLIHFFGTSRAAPVMLGLRKPSLDEAEIAARLDRFARWNAFRALFQAVALVALVLALAVA